MMNTLRSYTLMSVLLAAIAIPGVANATAILGVGGQIFATGGRVHVDILPSSSGFSNSIEFFVNFPSLASPIMLGIDNVVTTIDLGIVASGVEMVFGIISPQGTFVMGPGSRNPDGIAHAIVSAVGFAPPDIEAFQVGFEDLLGGGDLDFDDAIIRVRQEAVPEPSTLLLTVAGLIGLFGWRVRNQREA